MYERTHRQSHTYILHTYTRSQFPKPIIRRAAYVQNSHVLCTLTIFFLLSFVSSRLVSISLFLICFRVSFLRQFNHVCMCICKYIFEMSMFAFISHTCAHTHERAESDRESASFEKLMLVSQPLIENR